MSAITDALVSAGIPGEAASRIAEAIRVHVSDSVRLTASTAATTSGTSAATVAAVTQATTTEPETIEVQSALYSKGFAKFSGDNVFDGSVSLNGNVNWNGPRRPVNMVLSGAIIRAKDPEDPNSGRLLFTQKQVAVLNDYGDSKPVEFTVLAKATTAELVSRVVVTGVSFDAENCQLVSATTTLWAVSTINTQPKVYLFHATESNLLARLALVEEQTA